MSRHLHKNKDHRKFCTGIFGQTFMKNKRGKICCLMGQKLPGPLFLNDSPPPKILKKLSPQKIYHFKFLQLPLT